MSLKERALEAERIAAQERAAQEDHRDKRDREENEKQATQWVTALGGKDLERQEGQEFWFEGHHFRWRTTHYDYATDRILSIVLCDQCNLSQEVGRNHHPDLARLGRVFTEFETNPHDCDPVFIGEPTQYAEVISCEPTPTVEQKLLDALRQFIWEQTPLP